MQTSSFRSVLASLLVVLVTVPGCYRHVRLPAQPVPERLVPPVDLAGTPAPGLTRLVLDSVDGPAVVERLRGGSVAGVAGTVGFGASLQVATRVCVTPCVVDVAPGPQELRFTLSTTTIGRASAS